MHDLLGLRAIHAGQLDVHVDLDAEAAGDLTDADRGAATLSQVLDRWGTQEESQVVPLREARELRNVVQPKVDDALDARSLQARDERLDGFAREADREEVHRRALGTAAPDQRRRGTDIK
jgi:hypothetical protein